MMASAAPLAVAARTSQMAETVDYVAMSSELPLPTVEPKARTSPESPLGRSTSEHDSGSVARSEFPELLFYGLVPIRKGRASLELLLGDSLGTFAIEAFTLIDGDWAAAREQISVDQPLRVDIDMPAAVHESDLVTGQLHAVSASGQLAVNLTRDGQPVALRHRDGSAASAPLASPAELCFDVKPGH